MGPLTGRVTIWLATLLLLFLWLAPHCIAAKTGKVSWIYDGDTIKVDGIGKVRLIGVDTPERENSSRDDYYRKHYNISSERLRKISRKALEFNIRRVKRKQVTLQFDREQQDKFGRTLAYVYLSDGTLLNRLLIEQGLASVYRRFDFKFKQDFLAAEEQARQSEIGLWAR